MGSCQLSAVSFQPEENDFRIRWMSRDKTTLKEVAETMESCDFSLDGTYLYSLN